MPKVVEDKFNPFNSIKLFGHQDYFNNLLKLYNNKRFPKVLMLSGSKGSGKFTLAFHIINCFFTQKGKESYDLKNLNINTNNNFYKKIKSNLNENFCYLGKTNNKKIGIDEIRSIKSKFNTNSFNNEPRFTILDDADLLNTNSANSLLKLIEEPSDLNYFILINNKRKKIIDTLKSRSLEVKIFLKKKEKEDIMNKLIDRFSVTNKFYFKYIDTTTPGNLIRIFDCLNELNIKYSENFHNSAEILLDKFKKDKNDIYIETIKFILDVRINQILISKNFNLLKLNIYKRKILNLLFEFENFNLSKNSVLEFFRTKTHNV